jgi:hypothetical protein
MVKFSLERSRKKDDIVVPHGLGHKLGRTKDLSQAAYVELFKTYGDDTDLSEIANAWQTDLINTDH